MATLYWGGGTGTWDGFTATNWYTDVGRTTLSTRAPCATDDVVFDSASSAGSYTVTISNNTTVCKSCSISGPATGALTLAGSGAWYIYGSLNFPAVGFTRTYTGAMWFYGSGSQTITSNGVVFSSSMFFASGTYTLQDALNSGIFGISVDTGAVLDTNSQTITCGGFSSTTGTTAGTLIFGASTVTIASFGPNAPLTVNAGTSNITITGANARIGSGINYTGNTFYNVTFSNTAITTLEFYGDNTFNSLTFAGKTTDTISTIVLYGNVTVTGTLTIQGSNAVRRYFVRSIFVGFPKTLTVGSVAALTDVDFRDISVAGTSAPWSGTRLGNCGGNSNITFPAAKTVYWKGTAGAGGLWTSTSWAPTSGGVAALANFPLAQDTAIVDNAGLGSGQSITGANGYNVGTLTFTQSFGCTITGTGLILYGSFTLTAQVTASGLTSVFSGRSTQTITTANNLIGGITCMGLGTNVVLNSAIQTSSIAMVSGGLNTAGFTVSATSGFTTTTYAFTNPTAFSLVFGASTITAGGQGIFSSANSGYPSFTVSAGTSTITLTGASPFFGFMNQSATWNSISLTSSSMSPSFFGSNTFANFSITSAATSATSNPIYLYGDLTVTGTLNFGSTTLTSRRTIRSDIAGRQRTLTVGTLSGFSNIDFMDIAAAGAAAWSSGTSIGDCGGNSGITFTAPKTVYWNASGSTAWYSTTPWAATSGGTPSGALFPLPQDTVVFDNAGAASTVNMGGTGYRNICTLNASARTSAIFFSSSGTLAYCNDVVFGSGTTLSISGESNLVKRGTQIYDTLGKAQTTNLRAECITTTVQFGSAVSVSNFYIQGGVVNSQNYNLTVSNYFFVSASYGATVVNLGASTVTLGGSSTNTANITASTNLVMNAGSATFLLTSASSKTFAGGGRSYGAITSGGNNPANITGNNTIGTITAASNRDFLFAPLSTQTLNKIVGVGSAGSRIKIYTSVPGKQVTLVQSATGTTLGAVGSNSLNGGNNVNLYFSGSNPDYLYIKDVIYSGPEPVLAAPSTFLLLFR